MNQTRKRLLSLLGVLLLTGLVYSIGLNGPFVFDDTENLKPLNSWLNGDTSWLRVVLDNTSGLFGRPLSMASFVLTTWLFGPEIWGFKLGNLLVHLANGVLVYRLFSLLMQRQAMTSIAPAHVTHWLPLLGAAIWLLHPLLVSTVLYVIQRMAMLSAMFMLLTMLSYLHGRIALESGSRRRGVAWLLLAVPLFTLLASLSKENGILAPALCAVIEWFAFAPERGRKRPWPSQLVLTLGLFLPMAVAAALTVAQISAITGGYDNRPFSLDERLLTQTRVLWSYVSSLLLPFGPRLGLYHDDYSISHGLLDPGTTMAALLGWALAVAGAWHLRHKIPGFALGLGFFLVGHALESSIFPLLLYFEHRNYLPAAGAIWALLSLGVTAAAHLSSHLHHGRRIFSIAGISLVVVFALATAARASIWQSYHALLAQGLQYHPDSRWLRIDIAQEAMRQSPPNLVEARKHIDALQSSNNPSTRRLAGVWQLMIDCSGGLPATDESLQLAFGGKMQIMEADLLVALESLGSNVINLPCSGLDQAGLGNAFASMLDDSGLAPDHFHVRRLRFKAGQLYLAAGTPESALVQARMAYIGDSRDAAFGTFLAELELLNGNTRTAAQLVNQLDQLIPKNDMTGRRILENLRASLHDHEN